MTSSKHFAFRVSLLAVALAGLIAAPGAFAQTIHIELVNGEPVFVERPCDNEKGKVCNPKDSRNNINFVLRGAGPSTLIDRVEITGEGPNPGANAGCYAQVVSACGDVPAEYCTADHVPGQPWSVQVDFPNVDEQCTLRCQGNSCRLEVANIANWRWSYEVWVNVDGEMKMADPIIVNRGVNGN